MKNLYTGALYLLCLTSLLSACGGNTDQAPATTDAAAAVSAEPALPAAPPPPSLDDVLAAQPEDAKARYPSRRPKETLEFFEVKPGQVVVEVLPGSTGWYSKILLPYIGSEGRLIAVNYADAMWPKFGGWSEEQINAMKTWTTDFVRDAEPWRGERGAAVTTFVFGALPEDMKGTADVVLLIRALHNLARFENDGAFLTNALADVHAVLKPGGIVGIEQHEARADMPDSWANGNAGYLKRGFVTEKMQAAGFELVGVAEFNQNPKDQPTTSDYVWRLPPSYATAEGDAGKIAAMDAIGESNRMMLKFRKAEPVPATASEAAPAEAATSPAT
jgi:predicted methyltransferase